MPTPRPQPKPQFRSVWPTFGHRRTGAEPDADADPVEPNQTPWPSIRRRTAHLVAVVVATVAVAVVVVVVVAARVVVVVGITAGVVVFMVVAVVMVQTFTVSSLFF